MAPSDKQTEPGMDEHAASEELLAQTPLLRRYIEARIPAHLKGDVLADDVLQDVFVYILRNLRRYREQGADSMKRWAMTTAKRKVLDAVRRVRKSRPSGDLENLGSRSGAIPGVRLDVAEVLSRLEPSEQRLLYLRFHESLELDEVAQRVGVSRTTIHRQIIQLLEKLARVLAAYRNTDAG